MTSEIMAAPAGVTGPICDRCGTTTNVGTWVRVPEGETTRDLCLCADCLSAHQREAEIPEGTVTVQLFADGMSQISVRPARPDQDTHRLVVKAAERLSAVRDEEAADREPVRCPRCGSLVQGVSAGVRGAILATPCGHPLV